jgi:hypothetical protein
MHLAGYRDVLTREPRDIELTGDEVMQETFGFEAAFTRNLRRPDDSQRVSASRIQSLMRTESDALFRKY